MLNRSGFSSMLFLFLILEKKFSEFLACDFLKSLTLKNNNYSQLSKLHLPGTLDGLFGSFIFLWLVSFQSHRTGFESPLGQPLEQVTSSNFDFISFL